MALFDKKSMGSDDEEEIENLRLAALKSMKLKQTTAPYQNTTQTTYRQPGFGQMTRHRGFRGGKNFSRPRTNSNLIAIPIVDEEPKLNVKEKSSETSKLILPQDRYMGKTDEKKSQDITKESNDKFGRYDNSDKSDDSDSEMELLRTDKKRDDSLERIMEELNNEINVLEDKTSKISTNDEEKELSDNVDEVVKESDFHQEIIKKEESNKIIVEEIQKSTPIGSNKRKTRSRSRSRSPRYHSPSRKSRYSPNVYRPLSPLNVDSTILSTMPRVPLSPRSAAFVLENREILARRQMSPWKSRSRSHSSSPRRHRSGTSRRDASVSLSPSPERNHRKRREPPVTSVPEPEDPVLEARRRKFEQPVLKNNGIIKLKTTSSETACTNTANTTSIISTKINEQKSDSSPKFYNTGTPEAQINENMKVNDDVGDDDDDDLDDSLLLNPTVDDLWSDEESDSENEGRFKSKPSSSQTNKAASISFTKLTTTSYRAPVVPVTPVFKTDDSGERRNKRRKRHIRSPSRKSKSRKVQIKDNTVHENKSSNNISALVATTKDNKLVDVVAIENDRVELKDEGDLRAELSRRRAQRLIKTNPTTEAQPARLLKTALEDVVPNRSPSKVKPVKTAPADRRVLVLKRLNTDLESQLIESTNTKGTTEKAESSKLPIRMRLGAGVGDDVGRNERKKRSRSGRKKKALSSVQV